MIFGRRASHAEPIWSTLSRRAMLLVGFIVAVAFASMVPSAQAEDYPPGGLSCELAGLQLQFTPSVGFTTSFNWWDPGSARPSGDFSASSQRTCVASDTADVPDFFPGPVSVDLAVSGSYIGGWCFNEFDMTGQLSGTSPGGLSFNVPFKIVIPEMTHNPAAGTLTIDFNNQSISSPITVNTGKSADGCYEGGFSVLQASGAVALPPLNEVEVSGPEAVPDPSDLGVATVGTNSATPAPARFLCRVGTTTDSYQWGYIGNVPGGYADGNCRDGWHLDRQFTYTNPTTGNIWYGGYFFGNFVACGWTRRTNAVPISGSPGTACSTGASRSRNTFMSYVNCNSPCGDGTDVALGAACNEYANVRPFSSSPSPTDWLRARPAGYVVKWRYLSKNGQWVMARDANVPTGQGNWGFISRTCFSALPGAIAVT